MYRQSEKNLLNSYTSSTCTDNVVKFGLLTAEICWRVWGTTANFNRFRVLAELLHGTLVVGISQTAALNRERHLYSAGRPSRWALAHISSFDWYIAVCCVCFNRNCIWSFNVIIFMTWWKMILYSKLQLQCGIMQRDSNSSLISQVSLECCHMFLCEFSFILQYKLTVVGMLCVTGGTWRIIAAMEW